MRSRDALDAPEALILTMVLVAAADGVSGDVVGPLAPDRQDVSVEVGQVALDRPEDLYRAGDAAPGQFRAACAAWPCSMST